jgi:hypothetical protein
MKALQRLFTVASADLAAIQPEAVDEILCPLCMHRFAARAISDALLSVEHPIPSALGGRLEVITCRECNNSQGSAVEKHLVKAMHALDSLEGKRQLPAVIRNDSGHVAVNFEWHDDAPIGIGIVGKASNPEGVRAIRDLISSGGKLNFTSRFGFAEEPYWRAIFRAAYLATFGYFGYTYVLSEGAAQVRRILDGESPPNAVILEAYPATELPLPALVQPMRLPGVGSFFLVLFRLSSSATRWIAVVLPGKEGCPWDLLAGLTTKPTEIRLQVSPGDSLPEVSVRFDHEPLRRLREMNVPAVPRSR